MHITTEDNIENLQSGDTLLIPELMELLHINRHLGKQIRQAPECWIIPFANIAHFSDYFNSLTTQYPQGNFVLSEFYPGKFSIGFNLDG